MIPMYIVEWILVGGLTGAFVGYLVWQMYKEENKEK